MPLKRGGEGKSSDHISRCGVEAVDPLTPGGGGGGGVWLGFFFSSGERKERESASSSSEQAGVSLGKNTLPAAHGNKIGHSAPIWLVCFH